MKPSNIVYWTKVLLGALVGLLSGSLGVAAGDLSIGFNLFNGVSIALLVYIISYYVYKRFFLAKVGKTTKLLSIGIGGYFLSWIVVFALIFTLLSPSVIITSPASSSPFKEGESITITAYIATPIGTTFSGAEVNATISLTNSTILTTLRLDPSQTSPGTYTTTYNVTSTDPVGDWRIIVTASVENSYLQSTAVTVHVVSST